MRYGVRARPGPSLVYRWAVLLFISLGTFGSSYVRDSFGQVADLLERRLGFSDQDIGWLNAAYTVPSLMAVVIGGMIVDRIGTKRSTFLFAAVCMLGTVLTTLTSTVAGMASGRLIFGLGTESLIVAIVTAIARWFRDKELGLAIGVNLSIGRLGSYAGITAPSWAGKFYVDWQEPLLIAVAFSTCCVIGALVYWILETNAEQAFDMTEGSVASRMSVRDVTRFSPPYWYLVGISLASYSAVLPFDSHLVVLVTIVAMPLFGALVDWADGRVPLMLLGSLVLAPVYLLLAYTNLSPYLSMTVMSLAFSLLAAVLWPSMAYIVEPGRLGTAYGVLLGAQNAGVLAVNLLRPGTWVFTALAVFGAVFAYLLHRRER